MTKTEIDRHIDRAICEGNDRALENMLDCDRYTREGDGRALQGLGWDRMTLTDKQADLIAAALNGPFGTDVEYA